MAEKFQILSLSGGGARGLYTARVLEELELRFNTSISKHFDMVCGTSIGGILALGLAADIPAKIIRQSFQDNLPTIFPPPGRFATVKQALTAKFSPAPLKAVLLEIFEDRRIGDLKNCVLVPSINYSVGRVRAFKTPHNTMFYQDAQHTLVDVALATSAAPTYFPLHEIDNARYVDGGLVANNPILMGVIEAYRALEVPLERLSGLSIGNMGQGLAIDHNKSNDLGYRGWGMGQDIIALAMSAGEKLYSDMARMLLQGRLEIIDSEATKEQAHLLSLDNGSAAATEILLAHASSEAGTRVNDERVKEFFQHTSRTAPIAQDHQESSDDAKV
ncbi:CBASS cGAMP-activated phospholipase [Parahaliea aestuarii]|uniref:CBASS cGAMP-activated phospholipase n=1 Tax=Parahaliea aestuarii TaxID=1852021 RepID=UPI00164F27F0|nr:CBASS cGAMP-activated phospholipase [Parahaliea aestuarii]